MATISQIHANQQNAQHSTGPLTEAGKLNSSRNAITLGLYTRQDYVKPEERDIYKEFCETMYHQLAPENLLEESLTAEITGATWRLRRCSAAEAELADYAEVDPLLDDKTDKTRRSIERARAGAHSLLHRSINQLRRLQTDRACRASLNLTYEYEGLVDHKQVAASLNRANSATKPQQGRSNGLSLAEIEALCAPPPCAYEPIDMASFCKPETTEPETEPETEPDAAIESIPGTSEAPQTPRNAPCPCKSGQKYKRCCGRNAPPVLGKAA
jgi:hypothetical protein